MKNISLSLMQSHLMGKTWPELIIGLFLDFTIPFSVNILCFVAQTWGITLRTHCDLENIW